MQEGQALLCQREVPGSRHLHGLKEARNMLKGLLLAGNKEIDNSELPPGLAAIASIITGRTDPKIIDINEKAIREEIN